MSRRTIGLSFLAIGVFALGIRFIGAVIFSAGRVIWSLDVFHGMFEYLFGLFIQGMARLSLVAVLLGTGYLLWTAVLGIGSAPRHRRPDEAVGHVLLSK